jgi:hypothetical protein
MTPRSRSRFSRRLLAAPALVLLVLTGASTTPAPRPGRMVPGISVRLRATLKNQSFRILIMDGKFIPHRGRLDVAGTSGSNEGGAEVAPNQYLLLTDTSMMLVSPLDEVYQDQAPYDIGSLVAMVQTIDAGRPVGNPKVKFDRLPPDTLNGIPTRHYRFDVEYSLRRGEIDAITRAKGEYWLADLPVNFYNPFAGLARPKGGVPGDALPAIAALYNALKELQVGTVMKFVASGIIGEGTPNPTIYIRTVEAQRLKNVEVDESIFEIPKSYKKQGPQGRGGQGPGRRGGAPPDTT